MSQNPSVVLPKSDLSVESFSKIEKSGINVQGYNYTLKQEGGQSLYEKSIEEDSEYLASLADILKLENDNKATFIQSFKQHRDSIINFDEMFFFHYHQKASSIKASYEMRAEKLKKDKNKEACDKINDLLGNMVIPPFLIDVKSRGN